MKKKRATKTEDPGRLRCATTANAAARAHWHGAARRAGGAGRPRRRGATACCARAPSRRESRASLLQRERTALDTGSQGSYEEGSYEEGSYAEGTPLS